MIHAPAPIAEVARHDFAEIVAYWNNPAPFHAERDRQRAINNAAWEEINAKAPWKIAQLARWALEEMA